MVRQGDSKERELGGGGKLARESCINFHKELKNASLLGKSNLLQDLWLWEQGQRKGDLRKARREHRFTHPSAHGAQLHSTSRIITAQVRQAQIRILAAPDFTVGYTDQAWEDFLTHSRKPGRRSKTLRNRDPRGERGIWNKGGDATPAPAFEGLQREVLSVLVSCLLYRKGIIIS